MSSGCSGAGSNVTIRPRAAERPTLRITMSYVAAPAMLGASSAKTYGRVWRIESPCACKLACVAAS